MGRQVPGTGLSPGRRFFRADRPRCAIGRRGEGRLSPVRVPALQREAGELTHQIELGRPDVAMRRPEELCRLVVPKAKVVRDEVLGDGIDGIDQQVASGGLVHGGLRIGRVRDRRHPELEDETSAGAEVARGVAKALDLLGLCQDPNRNYGYMWGILDVPTSSHVPSDETYVGPRAFSEPETQAVRDLVGCERFSACPCPRRGAQPRRGRRSGARWRRAASRPAGALPSRPLRPRPAAGRARPQAARRSRRSAWFGCPRAGDGWGRSLRGLLGDGERCEIRQRAFAARSGDGEVAVVLGAVAELDEVHEAALGEVVGAAAELRQGGAGRVSAKRPKAVRSSAR